MKELVRGFLELGNVNQDIRDIADCHNNLVNEVDQLTHTVNSLQTAVAILRQEVNTLSDKQYWKAVKSHAKSRSKRKA